MKKIRKPVNELNLDDLRKSPVWEYASDEEDIEGQDETTVRPVKCEGKLKPAAGPFFVQATFTLADQTKLQGLLTVSVQRETDLGSLQPAILTKSGPVLFWCGMFEPEKSELKKFYLKLKRDAKRTFPIQVTSDVDLVGGPISATIPGFMVLVNWKKNKTKALT